MTDWSKISGDLRGRIEKIMAGDGADTKKLDSRNEYNDLAKLLSGEGKVTGDEKTFVEGMIADYEEAYMIRAEVKDRVLQLIRNGNDRKADDGVEVTDLKNYLNKTKGLTKEEKDWIKSVIKGREVKQTEANKTNEPSDEAKKHVENTQENIKEVNKKPNVENLNKKFPPKGFPPNFIPSPVIPMPVPAPMSVVADQDQVDDKDCNDDKDRVDNKGAAQSRQSGKDNVNVNGNNNTVIVNSTDETKGIVKIPEKDGDNFPPKDKKPVDQAQVEALANQIFDAVKGFGTKEDQLNNALAGLTKDNIIEVLNEYNANHPDMFQAIIDDLSGNPLKAAVRLIKDLLYERAQGFADNSYFDALAEDIDNELAKKNLDENLLVAKLNTFANKIQERET